MEFETATAEKDTIDRKAKLCLNKITPENYQSIRGQLFSIFKEAVSEDDKKLFVKVFFQKACHEEKYTSLYIDLIKFISTEHTKLQNNGHLPPGKFSYLKVEFVGKL